MRIIFNKNAGIRTASKGVYLENKNYKIEKKAVFLRYLIYKYN